MLKADKQMLLGVAGNPVLHSRSPMMFNSLFSAMGIDASYVRVAGRDAAEIMRLFRELDFHGMNITAPFKSSIIPHLDSISDDAKKTGSVNTVINRDGKTEGHNTDIYGITEPLREALPGIKGKNAVVAGAGGAGAAAAHALTSMGCAVTIVNRTETKAMEAASRIGCRHDSLDRISSYLPETDIFIPALPYEADAIDIGNIKKSAVILDASYKQSRYRDAAASLGVQFIDGSRWLLHQAVPAFRLFFSSEPDIKVMEKSLTRSLKSSNIAITGFMGCGKTSTGRELARLTGMEFIDTDDLIEKAAGMPVSSIFRERGEPFFRHAEEKIFASLEGRTNLVISCGGGAVLNEENRRFLKNNALTVWLYSSIKESLSRIPEGTRPLLERADRFSAAEKIFSSRKDLYSKSCDLLVSSERSVEETAEILYEEIRLSI